MSLEHKESLKNLHKRSAGAIFGILLSRFSGIFRTLIVNATFGFGIALDSFNAAFRLPNGLRDLFADGAFSAAFIKSYSDAYEEGNVAEQKLISIASGFFLAITISLAIIFCIFSDFIMQMIISNKFETSNGFQLASYLFKILAFFLPFTMLNALAMAVLGVRGKTFRAMNASIFFNIGMILGVIIFSPICLHFGFNGIYGLAIGALFGVFSQMIYQFKPLYHLNLLVWPTFSFQEIKSYKPLRDILRLMGPRAFAQGALTIALLINTYFATTIGFGALTYIVTAVVIIQVPIGLFGVGTGFSAQPLLNSALQKNNIPQFSILLTQGLEKTLLLSIMAVAGFALCIVPFYHYVFEYGKITYSDTLQNSLAVCAYSIGILFAVGSKILISAFFAFNRTRYLIYNAIVYLCTSATLSYLLTPKYGILGLGLSYGTSTAIDFMLNLIIFRYVFFRRYKMSPYFNSRKFLTKIVVLAICAYLIPLSGVWLIRHFWSSFQF